MGVVDRVIKGTYEPHQGATNGVHEEDCGAPEISRIECDPEHWCDTCGPAIKTESTIAGGGGDMVEPERCGLGSGSHTEGEDRCTRTSKFPKT